MTTMLVVLSSLSCPLAFMGGWWAGLKRGRPKAPTYLCACGHSIATHGHADHSGPCTASMKRRHFVVGDRYPFHHGDRNGWEYVNCACTGFVGERPFTLTDIQNLLKD